jgi:hypothetical protein
MVLIEVGQAARVYTAVRGFLGAHGRSMSSACGEPFDTIMAAAAALADGEELVVLAPFEPVASEGMLSSSQGHYDAADLGDGDWRVTFRRKP